MRCLVGDKISNWDMVLAQVEFAYNNSMNRSTRKTPFEIITGIQPRGVSQLRDIAGEEKRNVEAKDFSGFIKALHEEMKLKKVIKKIRRMLISLGNIIFLKLVMR